MSIGNINNNKKIEDSNNQLKEFINHMEFVGYEFEDMPDEPNSVMGKHNGCYDSLLTNAGGHTIFSSFIGLNSKAVEKRLQLLEIINELNNKSYIISFMSEDIYLKSIAMYFGPYEKKSFGEFLDAWHRDTFSVYEQEGFDQFIEQ